MSVSFIISVEAACERLALTLSFSPDVCLLVSSEDQESLMSLSTKMTKYQKELADLPHAIKVRLSTQNTPTIPPPVHQKDDDIWFYDLNELGLF